MKKPARVFVPVIIVFFISCCLFPVPVVCGAPGRACRTGPGPGGSSSIYYELEPLAFVMIEAIFQTDIPFYYTSWDDHD